MFTSILFYTFAALVVIAAIGAASSGRPLPVTATSVRSSDRRYSGTASQIVCSKTASADRTSSAASSPTAWPVAP